MSDDLLESVARALEDASEGPWQAGEALNTAVFAWHLPPDHPNAVVCQEARPGDAYFIAEARRLVPELAARIASLEAEVARLREALREAELALWSYDPDWEFSDQSWKP